MALPPFPPFAAAAYGPALLANPAMYRGGNVAQQYGCRGLGGNGGIQRVGGPNGPMPRGFDHGKIFIARTVGYILNPIKYSGQVV